MNTEVNAMNAMNAMNTMNTMNAMYSEDPAMVADGVINGFLNGLVMFYLTRFWDKERENGKHRLKRIAN